MKLICLMLLLSLVGCTTAPPTPAPQIVYKAIKVPDELTEKVSIIPPPDPYKYSVLPWSEQEAILMDKFQKQQVETGVCNARLGGVRTWSVKQVDIYSAK